MKRKHLLLCLMALFCAASVPAQKKVAFVYQPGYNASKFVWDAEGYKPELDPIHAGLAAAFTVTDYPYASTEEADYALLATYDLVVLSEAMPGNSTLTNNMKKLVGAVPILSMKAYNYTSGRWAWAAPANPGTKTPSVTINPGYESHPIFKDVIVNNGEVQIFDGSNISSNLIQGFNALIDGGLIEPENIIAHITGTEINAIHEIKALDHPYLMIPISSDLITTVAPNGVKLVVNACNYLMGSASGFDPDAPFKIAYLFDSSYANYVGIEDDPIFVYSILGEKECEAIDIKDFTAASTDTLAALENYDLIVVSEAMGSGHAFAKPLLQLVNRVPMLNFKSFFYKNTVWNWGAGVNPTSTKTDAGVPSIKVAAFMDHALFENIELVDSIITLFNTAEGVMKNLVQAYTAKVGGAIAEDKVFATVTGTTATYNAIHEHGVANKYLLLPISSDAMVLEGEVNLSDDAFQLISNAVYYLLQSTANILPALKPTFEAEYGNNITYVTLETLSEGADIRYTTDGSEPTTTSTLYAGVIEITTNCTIKAIAVKQGYDNSPVVSLDVVVKSIANTPSIAVSAAEVGKTVALTAVEGAAIYYSTNGGAPDPERSSLYTEPFTVLRPCVVYAVAVETDKLNSAVVSESITIDGYANREKTLVWANFNLEPTTWLWATGDSTTASDGDMFGKTGYAASIDSLVTIDFDNGFIIGTKGQRVNLQKTATSATAGNYGPFTPGDAGATDRAISFLRTNVSDDPTNGFVVTSTAYAGPFDATVWFTGAKGNSSIERLEVSVAANLTDTTWTVLDTLTSVSDKNIRKGVAYYDETAPVFVKFTSVSNLGTNSNMMVFDIKLMGEGQDVSLRKPDVNRKAVSTRYYNLAGIEMKAPNYGVTLVRTIYSDGSVETTKVLLRDRR